MADATIKYLRATGVAATDTAALQAAITAGCMAYDAWSWQRSVVLLSGHFMINAPLTMNTRAEQVLKAKRPCSLIGIAGATIEYAGTLTTENIIKCYGTSVERLPILEGLTFNCGEKCRGPLIDECGSYRCSMRDVFIYASMGVGLELISCWGSHFENVRIRKAFGIALRTTNYITSGWRNLHIAQQPVLSAHWPATDDTSVLDMNGDPIQTPDTMRAAVVLSGGNHTCHQTIFEGCYAEAYPLMFVGSANSLLSGIYMEGNRYTNSAVVFQGGSDTDGRVTFQNIIGDYSPSFGDHNSFLELRGNTNGVRVTDGEFLNYSTSIVRATEGVHTGVQVERIKTSLAETAWAVAEGAATVDRTTSVSGSARVTATDAYYLGDAGTDGSWRFIRSGNNLLRQRRESGNWVTKGTDTP